jgi:hypothetical protein
MMRVHALEFFGLGASATKIAETIFYISSTTGKQIVSSLNDFQKEEVKESIAALTDLCKRIGLPTSLALLDARKNNIPQTRGEWDMLVDAVRAELKTNLFLFVPMHRAKYYEITLQDTVTTAFPDASKELAAAGNCVAVGLYTACVFHSMHAVEIGVQAMAKALNVTFPYPIELAEWGKIIADIEPKINDLKLGPRSTQKDEDLKFYSEAASQFRHFNNGWRIRVAHARATYEEHQAIAVFDHTLSFFQTLADRLKE